MACFQKRCHNPKVVYFSSVEPMDFAIIVEILCVLKDVNCLDLR